ncbi:hypothetical protein KIH39_00240 [Telmatocola sphagniphila]|uniref:Uncharacterized protein n=1 Tax=Telmatocola sphagniphila TaxID=1123043 RepID=A0A8E6B6J2_9BACT|nr:hypothetical protein [Telmatocola sphagniphila]QVL32384.1 hypothetical protein KIH39_00240 [Telmatocola sphagniphila]
MMKQEGILPTELRSRIPEDVFPDLEAWIAKRFMEFGQILAQYEQRIATCPESNSGRICSRIKAVGILAF